MSLQDELLLVSPDDNAKKILEKNLPSIAQLRFIKDEGKGKPAALNLALKEAKNEILVLTDGDVFVDKNALSELLKPFSDNSVGAVTGHPVSLNKKDNMLGYWSHFLTDAAHNVRMKCLENKSFIECSGYLYAFKRNLISEVPLDVLSDDAVISHLIASTGSKITYAPESYVYVKYPNNFSDWLKQKVRSAGGFAQEYIKSSPFKMRTVLFEGTHGFVFALKYPKSIKQFFWMLCLFLARIYLWFQVFVNVRVLNKPFSSLWVRIESTK